MGGDHFTGKGMADLAGWYNISVNDRDEFVIYYVSEGLQKSKSLTSLNLRGNNLYNRDTQQLAASLRAGSSLVKNQHPTILVILFDLTTQFFRQSWIYQTIISAIEESVH
jgi:hypothetical protein